MTLQYRLEATYLKPHKSWNNAISLYKPACVQAIELEENGQARKAEDLVCTFMPEPNMHVLSLHFTA
jgi:hypothetical protein